MSQSTVRRIEDSTPFHTETNWIMAVLSIAAALGIVWWFDLPLDFDLSSPSFNPMVFLPVVLAGYGLVQAARAARARAQGRRFGASVFEMEAQSIQLGDTLRGHVITARDLRAPEGFVLRLRCIEKVRYASSAGSIKDKRMDVVRWEAERTVQASNSSSRGVPVEFAIPPAAAKDATGDPTRWTLEVGAVVEGTRYDALFGVPVTAAPAE
jgi:hypothetical protein